MERIAIIGTGVSGMAAGYFLKDDCEVTFYEKDNRPGGHTHTLSVDEDGKPIFIDSAFMVYNEITYPLLTRFFKELNVPTQPTDMSFSVQHRPSSLEYAGDGWTGLFAQRLNLLSVRHWKMLLEIGRFNRESVEVLEDPRYAAYSVMQYVLERHYSSDFTNRFLIPMSSAVWSTPPDKMLRFPVVTLVRFFKNHGFLGGLKGHYQWRTVTGGSRVYRDRVMKFFNGSVHLNASVRAVKREKDQVIVLDKNGEYEAFDRVIIAAHADQAMLMLEDPTRIEAELLPKFRYQSNRAVLHTDASVMPRARRAWAAWNYRIASNGMPSIVYWMNRLQNVSDKKDYFISINDTGAVDRKKILWEAIYHHPVFDVETARLQPRLTELNQNGRVYFCGAYFRYGFHEDGFMSGLNVARKILGREIWN